MYLFQSMFTVIMLILPGATKRDTRGSIRTVDSISEIMVVDQVHHRKVPDQIFSITIFLNCT